MNIITISNGEENEETKKERSQYTEEHLEKLILEIIMALVTKEV